MNNINEPQSLQMQSIIFDPHKHPEDTLKAFNEFAEVFELRYNAQFPDPPKVSLDATIERWKVENTTTDVPNPKPNIQEYDNLRNEWRSKDRVAKVLGMFSTKRLYNDWLAAHPNSDTRMNAKWDDFLQEMRQYYKPTENSTLKNYHFRDLSQGLEEAFPGFCNRIEREAKHCSFKCDDVACTAEQIAIRDQIIIGTHNDKIREKPLMECWDMSTLRKEGMRMESASRGGAEIGGEMVNKVGKYSFKQTKTRQNTYNKMSETNRKKITFF